MYSDDFDEEGSVEFVEDAANHTAPAASGLDVGADAQAADPVPLDDAELDAYLADDQPQDEVPAVQQDVVSQEVAAAAPEPTEELVQDLSSSTDADGDKQLIEPVAQATHSPVKVSDEGEPFQEESLEEPCSSQEEEDGPDLAPSDTPTQCQHTAHAAEQHAPAVQPAQPEPVLQPMQHNPSTAGASGCTSTSSPGNSHRSSMRSRKSSTTGQVEVPGVQELHEMWQAAGLPATALSADNLGDDCAGSVSPQSRFSTHSILQDSSPVQQRTKQRPASASPAVRRSSSTRDSLQEQQWTSSSGYQQQPQEVQLTPVTSWTVNDVCDWVDGLGLSQYRKKFMHHVVHGSLLLRLNDQLLRTELGIGPLGHRVLILDGIQAVAAADLQQAAAAALAGTSPEDYQDGNCSSPASAAAVLVAGLIALKAGQRGSSRPSSPYLQRIGSGSLGASPVNAGGAAGDQPDGDSSPAVRRVRPFSAPCKGKGSQRSPSPSGGHGSPSPGALGPAAGRISVYEQRAKILFELSRAQARAAATAGTASEVTGIAQLAQREVAMLQAQLVDLDKRNKLAVQHASGSVDSAGIIPWKHVGPGTNSANPHPERLARPWDAPDVELTFSPKISKKSKQLMAEARGSEGSGGFLDRLGNDMRRREAKQKELEKRYYSNSAAGDAASAKAAAADLATLTAFFSQRGWATLSVPSNTSSSGEAKPVKQLTEEDYRELDSQLDEVVETYSEELGLGKSDSKHSHTIMSAHGPKKLAAVVAAVRTVQFMDRYHADLNTRGSRLQQLQDNYFKQQPVSPGPGRAAVVPLTTEQKDLAQAVRWFKGMGWEEAAESDDCDDLLSALVKRAQHYKKEAEKLHEKERAAGAPAALAHSSVLPHPTINWSSAPWSVDGLGSLMQAILDARKAAAEEAAAKQAADSKPSAVDTTLKQAGKQAAAAAGQASGDGSSSAPVSAATLEAAAASGANTLDLSVRLLAGMRWAGLEQLDAARGAAKKLAVYRALRTQQFLAFTAKDLADREIKQKALLQEFEASRRGKLVSQAELDEFYQRLQADGERRKAELEKARQDKADREAKALALVSVGPGFSRRPRSAK